MDHKPLLLSAPATSLQGTPTPPTALNIKGLSLSVSSSRSSSVSTPTPITPNTITTTTTTTNNNTYPPAILFSTTQDQQTEKHHHHHHYNIHSQQLLPLVPFVIPLKTSSESPQPSARPSLTYQTRPAPNSVIDPRPVKRRRPSPGNINVKPNNLPTPPTTSTMTSSNYIINQMNMSVQPNHSVIPLTPDTPIPQQDQEYQDPHNTHPYMLPATPITPVSSLDFVHHASNSTFQCPTSKSNKSGTDSAFASSQIIPTSDLVNFNADPNSFFNNHRRILVHPSKFGSYLHTMELAAIQTVTPQTLSGKFLVAEHRGLISARPASRTTRNMFHRMGGDGVLAIVPTSGLELKFRTEARVQPSDHFLRCLTNMGGGAHVAVARKHTIAWLIELNQHHQLFRYKINTVCVAVQFMDRFVDLLAREGTILSNQTAQPKIAARNGSPGPFMSAIKPAPLEHWRSYDWYLLAVVCLSMAAKMVEEYDDPTMRDMVSLDFDAHHIRQIQISVAKTLKFDFGAASPVNFVIEYLSMSPIRDLLAELLPHHRSAQRTVSGPSSPIAGVGDAHLFATNSPVMNGHGLATPPLSPPPSLNASPSIYQSASVYPPMHPPSDIVLNPAPSSDLEQFQGMVTPVILEKVQSVAEQYLINMLPYPESASFAPSEMGMAATNLALEVRSLMVNAVIRVNPVTGARHVDYLPKSLALGFYGTPMTDRANAARDLMLRILPRERFFMLQHADAGQNVH